MTQEQVIHRANEWVQNQNGACVAPVDVRISKPGDGQRSWTIIYDTAELMRACGANFSTGTVVDGPYVVVVDDVTAEVTVLG